MNEHERQRPVVLRARAGGPRAGRRQERLARRDGAEPRRPRASRCPTASRRPPTPTAVHRRHRPGRADHRPAGRASTPTTSARSPRSARRSGTRSSTQDVPRGPRGGHPRGLRRSWSRRAASDDVLRRALQRHRRGPAGRLVRRPAGDLPQRPRHRRVLHAIKEVFASLYNDRAIAYRVHHGFEHGDVGALRRRAADGALRRRRLRRDVHDGHRVRLRRRGLHHLRVRPRRGRRPGRGEPRRVLRLQAGPARRAARRSSSAAWATRRPRWSTPTTPTVGRTTEFVDVEPAERRAAQPHRRRGGGAGPARAGHRGALRPPDGHRVGQGRRRRRALHPAGAPGDRAVARRPASLQRFRLDETPGRGRWSRAARSARRSAPAPCGC